MSQAQHYPSHPSELADQDAFRAARRDGLYSTDSTAILQLSRWGSPLSVYRDKVEPIPPAEPASLQAWLGWRLESTLAQLYAERYGKVSKRDARTHEHPDVPFVKTHLDFTTGTAIRGDVVLVECKTRSQRSPQWGPDGSGKVPPDVWTQVQHELMVTGASLARIPVLFGLHTFACFEVEPDPGFHAALLGELDRFWNEHVLPRKAPEPTAMPVDQAWSKRHQQTDESLEQATPEMEQLLKRRRMAAIVVAQAEASASALDAQIRDLIGEHAGIQGTFGEVTYKTTRPSTDWKLLAGTYQQAADELLELVGLIETEDTLKRVELISQQLAAAPGLYQKPGYRKLSYKWSDETEDTLKRVELISQQPAAAPGLYQKPGYRKLSYKWSDEGASDE